jgi:GTP-dependent phosphoenolpyruvate carboxykinase
MMKTLMANSFYPTLYPNAARETPIREPWGEGMTDSRPAEMLAWQGKPWQPGAPAAENFPHQLVSDGREGQVHLAGLR